MPAVSECKARPPATIGETEHHRLSGDRINGQENSHRTPFPMGRRVVRGVVVHPGLSRPRIPQGRTGDRALAVFSRRFPDRLTRLVSSICMAVMQVIPLATSHRSLREPRAQDMTHEHSFSLKSRTEQKRFQARLVSVSPLFIGAVSALLYLAGLLPLIFLVFALVLSIIAPFLDVPSMVRSGKLRYYSPFLLGETERNSTLVLHAGTLFDSWFLFRKNMPASERKRLAMGGMIEGMINLSEEHKRADRRDLKVRTTSYILNERSAEKLGLEKRPTDAFQTLILYYNYFKPTVEQGIARGEIEVVVVEDQRLERVRGPFFKAQLFGASFVQDIARRANLQVAPVGSLVLLDQVDHALDHSAHRQPFSLAGRHVLSKQEPGIEQRSGVQYQGRIPLGLAEQERGVVAQLAGPDHGRNVQERGDDAQHEGEHEEDQRQQTCQVKQGADGADEQQ